VRYIEMRSLDLDLFNPIGIDIGKARFIEALLLTCLLKDSPDNSDQDHQINNANQLAVANEGRKPGLQLQQADQSIGLQDWAMEILESMRPVCSILDNEELDKPYSVALEQQMTLVNNPQLTASARILEGMTQTSQPFSRFALSKSKEHEQYFKHNQLDKTLSDQFDEIAKDSLIKQHDIESKPQIPFDEFLAQYFAQH
jgi:glutamate--cysteine ligase